MLATLLLAGNLSDDLGRRPVLLVALGALMGATTGSRSGSSQFAAHAVEVHAYTTAVDAVVIREGKNLKGRVLAIVLGTVGKRVLSRAFADTVKAVEARNDRAHAAA